MADIRVTVQYAEISYVDTVFESLADAEAATRDAVRDSVAAIGGLVAVVSTRSAYDPQAEPTVPDPVDGGDGE